MLKWRSVGVCGRGGSVDAGGPPPPRAESRGGRGGDAATSSRDSARDGGGPPASTEPARPQTPTERHFNMSNLAAYPAINLPNGFLDSGSPTNVTLYARPFGEMELIALAKAYQDAAGFHLRRPKAIAT